MLKRKMMIQLAQHKGMAAFSVLRTTELLLFYPMWFRHSTTHHETRLKFMNWYLDGAHALMLYSVEGWFCLNGVMWTFRITRFFCYPPSAITWCWGWCLVFCEWSRNYWAHFLSWDEFIPLCFILTPFFEHLSNYKSPLYLWPFFRQDSATAHIVKQWCVLFTGYLWWRNNKWGLWPHCLPDLNPCNRFLFFGHQVFNNNSHTENIPADNIQDIVFSVSPAEVWCGMNSLFVRCDCCLGTKGRHFENCLNMVSKSLILPAVDGKKLCRPHCLASWNNGAHCAACELPDR